MTFVLHSLLPSPCPAGKWTVQQAAELSVAAPTITASLDGRYMSALKDQRVAAAKFYGELGLKVGVPCRVHVVCALQGFCSFMPCSVQ